MMRKPTQKNRRYTKSTWMNTESPIAATGQGGRVIGNHRQRRTEEAKRFPLSFLLPRSACAGQGGLDDPLVVVGSELTQLQRVLRGLDGLVGGVLVPGDGMDPVGHDHVRLALAQLVVPCNRPVVVLRRSTR